MEAVNGLPGVADRLEVGTDRRAVRHARRAQRSRPTFPPSPNPARPAVAPCLPGQPEPGALSSAGQQSALPTTSGGLVSLASL